MGKHPERQLLQRLARVQALEDGATTPGERAAAVKAKERVTAKIVAARSADQTRQFCRAYVRSLGIVDRPPGRPPRHVPTDAEIDAQLQAWQLDERVAVELMDWASEVVDQVLLPQDLHHEAACRAEVLLQLASRDLGHLRVQDVPAIRAFLAEHDWSAWFELLTTAAARARRARRSA